MTTRLQEKMTTRHRERQAYVYVRQSTPHQVHHHLESQRNQYALVQRAIDLGWPHQAVTVLDEDQVTAFVLEQLALYAGAGTNASDAPPTFASMFSARLGTLPPGARYCTRCGEKVAAPAPDPGPKPA